MHFQSFVYTVAGALIFAAAAFGQPGSPTAGSQQPTKRSAVPRTADGKPDLQGVWSFATLTPLERPAEFAGKAYLTPQEAKEYAKRTMQRNNKDKRDGGAEADVSRAYNELFYDYGASASLQTSLIIDPPDGKLPALTPEGKKRAEARVAAMTRLPRGPEDRSLNERCILGFNSGPPMFPSAYNNNVQIVQTKDYVVLFTEMVHDARIVPLDGRPHSPVRQWAGDSRGHWEGDTLVIDTINFTDKGTTVRTPVDENFHLTERLTGRDENTLTYEFIVDDPTVQTRSWTASVPMTRSSEPIYEYACHEGNYSMVDMLAGARAEEAKAEGKKK